MDNRSTSKVIGVILVGLLIGILSLVWMVGAAKAESGPRSPAPGLAASQVEGTPSAEPVEIKECIECHPDKKDAWTASPHALAFESRDFQEGWKTMHQAGECLLCHTTNYQEATGEYSHAGVSCEACHGATNPEHPAVDYPVHSDKESCGTCHPATLGEAQLSGHTGTAEVGCMDCHDPHSQGILFENPDDMCKECHEEDLAAMDEVLASLHLRENITCAGCHTLDVPHTFLRNLMQENMTVFMAGRDCGSEISDHLASHTQSESSVQVALQTKMNWPVVHRVSRAKSALECTDCHEMDENTRADFKALGYTDADLDQLSWNNEGAPKITDRDLSLLVSRPASGWSWIFWLLGIVLVFALFEVFVTRKLRKTSQAVEEE
ncbi:MAG: cytochrome c3 family protein [Anaerolineales bacterium]